MDDWTQYDRSQRNDTLDLDRLSALEARLQEHEQLEIAARPQARLALGLLVAGAAFALGALVVAPVVMLVLSAACFLVLIGMNSKKLARINAATLIASSLVVFVFVPALDEMSRRADEATKNMVQTVVSGSTSEFELGPAFQVPEDLIIMMTPVTIDGSFEDNGAVLPE